MELAVGIIMASDLLLAWHPPMRSSLAEMVDTMVDRIEGFVGRDGRYVWLLLVDTMVDRIDMASCRMRSGYEPHKNLCIQLLDLKKPQVSPRVATIDSTVLLDLSTCKT